MELQNGSVVGPDGAISGVTSLVAFPVGVRWNPFSFGRQSDAIKPFVAAGVGPVLGEGDGSYSAVVAAPGREAGNRSVLTGARTSATVGGYLRGGADFQFARSFTIGVDAGYNWVADFAQPVGVRKNYSGFGMGVGLGVLFGRGTAARPSTSSSP